jgi:ketosteroid isomerase-like protein
VSAHAQQAPAEAAPEPSADEKAVFGLIRRFGRAYASGDVEVFMSIWDDEYGDRLVYQPEELGVEVNGLEALRAYFEHVPEVVREFRDIRPIDFRVEMLDGFALVHNRFWVRLALTKRPFSVDGQVRQTFVVRKRDDGEWKAIHYHESRLSPGFEEAVGPAW